MLDSSTGPPESLPPPGANRGVEVSPGARVGFGWMDGSARAEDPEQLVEVLRETFGSETRPGPRTGFYSDAISFDVGRAHVMWNGRENARGTTRCEVEQSACDELGWPGSFELARRLREATWRPSRNDLWLDDYLGRLTVAKVDAAIMAGQAVTHARPGRLTLNRDDGSSTYYLGQPASDRRMRTYDYRGPVRAELQARRRWAVASLDSVLKAEDPPRAVLSNLVSFVDFRESRKRDRVGARAARLPWWDELVGETVKAEGVPSRPELSPSALAVYVMGHWARTLAELERHFGSIYLDQLIRHGRVILEEERAKEKAS